MRQRSTAWALALAVPLVATAVLVRFVEPSTPADGGVPKKAIEAEQSTRARPAEPARRDGTKGRGEGAKRDQTGAWRSIRWRRSRAIGLPQAGRLVRGVQLPAGGVHFFTWDPIHRRSPNRAWRRWGTDDLVRATLRVVHAHAAAHPAAPRVGIGDLSRPHGGDFGPAFGAIGHATHQSGLDVDVYYPLRSGTERAPPSVDEVNLTLAQDLVDRFVLAGAVKVYVGPNTGLTGPPGVVEAIPLHDNHLHARLPG
jgi:hypothetical protein